MPMLCDVNNFYIYVTNICLERLHEILIAKRKIGASYAVCASPDTPCIAQLDLIEKGRDIRCVMAINQQLKLLYSRKEKRSFYLDMVKQSISGYSSKHYIKPNWIIGPPQLGISNCCRKCVCHFYEIGDTTLTKYCALVKKGQLASSDEFNDKSAGYVYNATFKSLLNDMAARSGITLDHNQIAAMLIPNTREVRYSNDLAFLFVFCDIHTHTSYI